MSNSFNVLISSASYKAPLVRAFQCALKQIFFAGKVFAGDINKFSGTRYVADSFWIMPPTCDRYLAEIIRGLKTQQIRMVLPTRDSELEFWSRNAEQLALEGIHVVVSGIGSLRRCLDKLEFARFGADNLLPFVPASKRLEDIQSNFIVVKERFGSGSKSIGIKLDRLEAANHAKKLVNPIFQPFIEGNEISIDAWLDSKYKVKGLILRYRDCVVNGESQVTTTFSNSILENQFTEIFEYLELKGPVVMQAILDVDGKPKVIECNPRFGGASTIAIEAGLASLQWSLLEASGANLNDFPFKRIPGQIRQIRLSNDLYVPNSDF